MKNKTATLLAFTALSLTLGGCDFMQNHVGKYMPTIGEPCNNWQCFTSGGQAQSEINRREREKGGSPARLPLNGNQPAQPAPLPAKAPASHGSTPFDMTPEQLGEMTPHSSEE